MNELQVVFSAGQIGTMVAEQLRAAGAQVRQVRRSGGPVHGDLADLAFAEQAARGASVIFHCLNLPYHQWSGLEALTRGVVHAAKSSGARVVVLDNLYMYGRSDAPFTESTPVRPVSRKGEIRARLATMLLESGVPVAIGRAADFYGPGVTTSGVFSERFFRRVLAGKSGECMGDPDQLHSYSYGPDVARGLIALSQRADAFGQVWHLPVAPAESTRAVIARFSRELGHEIAVSRLPDLVLRALGLIDPVIRELPEMTYQWKAPFVLDDAKFRAAFGAGATSLDDGVRATAAWALSLSPQRRGEGRLEAAG